MRHLHLVRVLVGALCALLLVGCSGGRGGGPSADPSASAAASTSPPVSTPAWAKGFVTVTEASLPAEARQTLRLIDAGGPFPYEKDGSTFGNYERVLPRQKRGYYREYTVRTPRERDRGARRIVTGRGGEFFYTDDHYDTFKAVLR
ncbi:guanine-specific ribonuclease N1 and T1 [Streptomyces sp. TRM66268-LWL]|uniref:Guanine-specific ribonuclease N1 and T1 n=1 Tax=Streptomyces polyasparticus TaxID=2767826 RepID=A0ABR7SJN3_9ACTN|nr:ribonuclease domain-containing protein [Streptomyces polyasparticus]MBC9715695.1 guanine-specific ribonuclease N1 and T1 [Streptomyces polyasparticus]